MAPPRASWSVGEFALLCWALCRLYSASETSGVRTLKRAKAVGSTAPASRHLIENVAGSLCGGKARDLALDENTPERRAALVRDAQLLGLYALDEGDHVHVHDDPL